MLRFLIAVLALAGTVLDGHADTVRVAVATNFRPVLEAMRAEFEDISGAQLAISSGSTGQLAAQISNGAPFDVFLAADQARPEALIKDKLAVASSRFTYAGGRLALLTPGRTIPPDGAIPDLGDLTRISIANPRTAPYGLAAMDVLDSLDIAGVQLVLAQNAGGVVAAVMSGAAPAGLTSLSLAKVADGVPAWTVPADLHAPIPQDAVLLAPASENAAAVAFLDWLKGAAARNIIRANGYALD